MTKDELGDIEWLAACTTRERAAIRKRTDILSVPAGTTLIREGDPARWFYAVIAGEATVRSGNDIVGAVRGGDPVNEVDVLNNELSTTSVTADTDLQLLAMGRREFLGMLDEVPGLARRLLMPHVAQPVRRRSRRPVLVPLPAA